MARTNKEKMMAIDTKIEKAKKRVDTAEKKYQEALDNLEMLMKKRDTIRNDELIAAITASEKTFDEIMEFLGATKRPGRKKNRK